MKIKKLVLQNINSLYGKWEIDFDCEKFRQSGIFAITGKTGSGKSSILDAMCLALYGTTPRLNKDTSEAVSRGCSEAMCELTFLDTDNQEWIATFAYEMITRGANKGKMNGNAIHRLACNGKTVADKTTRVRTLVEEITGLDADRFCRAVMLAQGSFDAFLNAGKENGEILERITGTEIYSRIADKLKERYNSEKSKLAAIEAQFEGITIMSDEEAAEVGKAVELLTAEVADGTLQQSALNKLYQKFQQLELLNKNLEKCNEDEKLLAAENLEFAAQRKRFESGKKVLAADEKYRPLKELQAQQTTAAAALQKNEELLKEQDKAFEENSKALEKAAGDAEKYEKEFEELNKILTIVHGLDNVIETLNESTAGAGEKRRTAVTTALQTRRELAEIRRKLADLTTSHSQAIEYLANHSGDGELAAVQKICTEWLKNIQELASELVRDQQADRLLSKEVSALQKNICEKEALLQNESGKLEKITVELKKSEEKITALLDGAAREHWLKLCEIQEKCYQQALTCRSLEEHRKQLKDGEVCPLCGAVEHPFALGNMPRPEKEFEELQQLKAKLNAIDNAEQAKQKIIAELNCCSTGKLQCQSLLEQLQIQLGAKQREVETLNLKSGKIQSDIAARSQQLDDTLAAYSLSWNRENFTLPEELTNRIKAYDSCQEKQAVFEQKSGEYQQAAAGLQAALKTLRANCRELRSEWKDSSARLAAGKARRQELFGSKDPAAESAMAEKKKKSLTELQNRAQKVFTETAANRSRTAEDIKKLQDNITALNEELVKVRREFELACTQAGVTGEEFLACVLPKEEMMALAAADADLKARDKQLSENRKNFETAVKELNAQLVNQKSKEQVVKELEDISVLLQEKNQELGSLKQQISNDAAAKEKMAQQHAKLLEQKKIMELWEQLYDLVGVKDKFQRFAQGITLEHLLVLANFELEKLSGRYRLLRSQQEVLGIDVADKDQGDEIRNCKTLSGGERFLVSLALALGLSQMAGEKIRVDSLFLDEGFGTLDAETLDTALEALSNLRNRGKLVGVISHVAAFSEKIPCIIEVHKTGGGRSTLQGPGVKAI